MKDSDITRALAEKVKGWKLVPSQRAWFKDGARIVSEMAWNPLEDYRDVQDLEGSIPEPDRAAYVNALERIVRFDEPRALETGSWLCLRATPRQKSLAMAEVCCGIHITLRRQACAV